jgi:hypothetical protein
MPTTASMTFGAGRVDPIKGPEDPRVENVNLQANLTLAGGTILAELVGNDEVQQVTITGTPTGGTFTLTYGGQTTAGIAYNATAAAVQTALEALSSIGVGNALVTGGPGPGTAWNVQFRNVLGRQNVAQMTTSGAGLTGGSSPASAVSTTTQGSAGTPGTYGPYSAAATNGLQLPAGVLQYACTTDGSGNVSPGTSTSGNEWGVTRKYAQMYVQGEFSCADLVGLDMNCVAVGFGRLVQGTVTSGRFLVYGS